MIKNTKCFVKKTHYIMFTACMCVFADVLKREAATCPSTRAPTPPSLPVHAGPTQSQRRGTRTDRTGTNFIYKLITSI